MNRPLTDSEAVAAEFAGLPAIPGGWTAREIAVLDRTFRIALPACPDAFLDDPDVHAANACDGYMPYWSELWPASLRMSEAVATADWPHGTEVLEIGAGIGLVGVVALSRGMRVTFSDYDQNAVSLALHNAQQNGFGEAAAGLHLDWRQPVLRRFPVILGCDVIYEAGNHEPILNLLDSMLDFDGTCWLADGGRAIAARFAQLARERGWRVTVRDEQGRVLPGPQVGRYQLLQVSRRG